MSFFDDLARSLERNRITRRQALWLLGAGAASRHSIGTGIVGGMLAATGIAIFFIPSFFAMIMGLSNKKLASTSADVNAEKTEVK